MQAARCKVVHFYQSSLPFSHEYIYHTKGSFKLIPECGSCGKNAIIRETSLPDNTAEHIITTYYSTEIQKSNDINSLVFFSYLAYRKKCYHGKDSFLLGYDKDNRIPTLRGKVVSSSSRFRSRS